MCGIFGIINTEKKPFDYQTFCTLGICNDERGGDSCGVFIDGKYEYGIGDEKYFSEFYKKSKLLQETDDATIALGHCRKASIGVVGLATAQPVVISNNKGEVEFVVVHNGTIFNYEDLAKKYIPDINIKGLTDSQVMARIFYYAGYNVLGEYNGGAAFVIVDYRYEKPEVMLFKGASLNTSVAVIPTEERPLFITMDNGILTFSSIAKFMRTKKKCKDVYTCPHNKLVRVNDKGTIEEVQVYDRSEKYQFRIAYESLYDEYYGYGGYRGYDGYHEYGGYSKYNAYTKYYGNNKGNSNSVVTGTNHNNNTLLIGQGNTQKEKDKVIRHILSNDDGTYSVDKQLAQGFYFINEWGRIVTSEEKHNDRVHIFFFWQGVLLLNKECYKFLKKMSKCYNITEGQLIEDYPLLVHSLSPDPFKDEQSFGDNVMYQAITGSEFKIFGKDQWQFFMSTNCYYFDENGLIATSWDNGTESIKATFNDYARMCDDCYIDFASLIDEFNVY